MGYFIDYSLVYTEGAQLDPETFQRAWEIARKVFEEAGEGHRFPALKEMDFQQFLQEEAYPFLEEKHDALHVLVLALYAAGLTQGRIYLAWRGQDWDDLGQFIIEPGRVQEQFLHLTWGPKAETRLMGPREPQDFYSDPLVARAIEHLRAEGLLKPAADM